jgi:putative ATP-dependent endonuclease of OLD family
MLNPDWDFDHKNIALVRVSGKGNFAKFRRFFEAFGIEVKIVADLDALFDGYQHLGAAAAVAPIRTMTLTGIDARVVALGTKAEPAARQIKDKLNQDNWRVRWAAAKDAVSAMQQSQTFDPAAVQLIDNLFVWEQEIARVKVCREDATAQSALIPTLDEMRASGICVLSRGAIEDYYPAGTPPTGSKPERALAACKLVQDATTAIAVSTPLAAGRQGELHDIFSELFRGA